MVVAIIPARGGSKRIKDKNIKGFAGKPVICHSIAAARAAGIFHRIIVSTDSPKIAAVARGCGAETPFMRPASLADDHTPTAPVLTHALETLREGGDAPAHACCIYAAAPFVTPGDLRAGHDLLIETGASAAFSVTTFPAPVFRALEIGPAGNLSMLWPEHELTRSNDLPEAYHDAGQFYWVHVERFLASGRLYATDALPVVLPRHRVQDIDTEEDWRRAELMHAVLAREAGA